MQAYDFEYDHVALSTYGYSIANIATGRASVFTTISNGGNLTFNTVPFRYGERIKSAGHVYEKTLTTKIQICPNPCLKGETIDIHDDEIRELARWLCREKFLPLRILNEDFTNLNFNAVMNMSKLMLGSKTIGLELEVLTDSAFALGELETVIKENNQYNWRFEFPNLSDKEGIHYPDTTIEVYKSGTLNIVNEYEDLITTVRHCTEGEIIHMDYPLITSSIPEHKIQNDFNWNFVRMVNGYKNHQNHFYCSLPGKITIKYIPYIKLGFDFRG